MKQFLKIVRDRLKAGDRKQPISKDTSNEELIAIYNRLRSELNLIPADEPNYALAKKVFLDFNEFNLRNLEIHLMYLEFVPRSLLPYPKNYIKCAYFIFLDSLRKANDQRNFEAAREVGVSLFTAYPDYDTYKENLKHKSMYDDQVFKDENPSPRELFKRLYGAYQISEKEYYKSPSSTDASREKLIHDYGVVPEIGDDVHFDAISWQRRS